MKTKKNKSTPVVNAAEPDAPIRSQDPSPEGTSFIQLPSLSAEQKDFRTAEWAMQREQKRTKEAHDVRPVPPTDSRKIRIALALGLSETATAADISAACGKYGVLDDTELWFRRYLENNDITYRNQETGTALTEEIMAGMLLSTFQCYRNYHLINGFGTSIAPEFDWKNLLHNRLAQFLNFEDPVEGPNTAVLSFEYFVASAVGTAVWKHNRKIQDDLGVLARLSALLLDDERLATANQVVLTDIRDRVDQLGGLLARLGGYADIPTEEAESIAM